MVALACRWIESGTVDALEMRKRRDAAAPAAGTAPAAGLRDHRPPGAYYLWLALSDDRRADGVAAALARQGVLVTTAEPFCAGPAVPQALRLALGSIALPALEDALRKVAALAA